jgi:hypothetical protein
MEKEMESNLVTYRMSKAQAAVLIDGLRKADFPEAPELVAKMSAALQLPTNDATIWDLTK